MGFFDAFIKVWQIAKATVSKLVGFFKKVISYIKETWLPNLQRRFGEMLQGIKTYVQKIGSQYQEKDNGYAYDRQRDQWTVTETTREVPSYEVPADIRALVEQQGKVDTTARTQRELENAS